MNTGGGGGGFPFENLKFFCFSDEQKKKGRISLGKKKKKNFVRHFLVFFLPTKGSERERAIRYKYSGTKFEVKYTKHFVVSKFPSFPLKQENIFFASIFFFFFSGF